MCFARPASAACRRSCRSRTHGKDKLPDRLGIRCGGRFDSHLLLPVTRGEIVPAP
jgi:hypothetical protein